MCRVAASEARSGLTNIKIMIPFCRTMDEGAARAGRHGSQRPSPRREWDRGLRHVRSAIEHERNDAVRWLIARVIAAGHRLKKPVGICGQAPSDYPEFAEWLVSQGIDSISLNPDVAVATTMHVAKAEADQSSRSVPLSR
jgi:phosphoenolpyruvate synthase/pyruvate phosphate dikinase